MKTRLRTVGAVALAAALTLSGCGGGSDSGGPAAGDTPVPGGTLVYGTDVQPQAGGLDPYVFVGFANQNVIDQIYEPLLTKDDDGAIQPLLASSYEQVDETTYTFTLREGVTFSDGTPVTVDDVIFSYETMKASGATQKPLLTALESVTAVDESTVQMTLSQPSGTFLNLVSDSGSAYIVNEAWYTSTPPEQRQRAALGTGPFVLDEWQENVSISLLKNTKYWDSPKPYLDGVTFQIVPDEQARFALLQQGSADAVWLRDANLAADAEMQGYTTGQNAATRGINLFINSQTGPLSDVRVRQAVSMGIDRESIIELAANGNGEVSLIAPAGDPGALQPDEDTPNYAHDPEAAEELLAETADPTPTITLTYASDASFALDVPTYEVMQQQLKDVGIDLQLNAISWSDVLARYASGNYTDLVAVPGISRPDVAAYFSALAPGMPSNKVAPEPAAEVASLLTTLQATVDPEARQTALAELEDYVAEQALMLIPYTQTQRQEVWSDALQGYSADPYTLRIHLKDAWLSE